MITTLEKRALLRKINSLTVGSLQHDKERQDLLERATATAARALAVLPVQDPRSEQNITPGKF